MISFLTAYLTGCSLTSLPDDVRKSIGQTESGITDGTARLANTKTIQQENYIRHTNSGYIANKAIIQNENDFLPPIFSSQIQIDKQFFGIRSVATGLTDLVYIPTLLDFTSNASSNNDGCADVRITQQEGNLIDLLNLIGSRCDLSWIYREGKIILSDTETKIWPIKGIPGDVQVQNQINNNSGAQSQSGANGISIGSSNGSGSAGQSQVQSQQTSIQTIAFNLQDNLWKNLHDSIKSVLSPTGKLNVSPSTSSVTVTDKPSILLRVDRLIKSQNDIMKRQVQIDVQVLNVDVEAQDNYGINWGLVLNGADAQFTINGQAVSQIPSAAGNGEAITTFTKSAVFIPTNTTQAFTLGTASGNLNGSSLIINALSSITKTSLVTSTAVTTLSNQPVPVQFIDQISYLASAQSTISGQGGLSQVSLTPGQITTGFSLNILPVIQSDSSVFLQLSINISALKRIAQFTSGGSSLQLPETLQRNIMQKAVIRSGDTFVVTGFDSDEKAINNSGVGGAYNWLLGGGVSADRKRTRMVILVTPRVVNI